MSKVLVAMAILALAMMSFTPRAIGFWCECRHDFTEQADCLQENCHPNHDHSGSSDDDHHFCEEADRDHDHPHDHDHDNHSHQTVEKTIDLTSPTNFSPLPAVVFYALPLDFPLITQATLHTILVERVILFRPPNLPPKLMTPALIRSTMLVI